METNLLNIGFLYSGSGCWNSDRFEPQGIQSLSTGEFAPDDLGIRACRSRVYDKEQFDMIMKCCIEEFNFELMIEEFYLKIMKSLSA